MYVGIMDLEELTIKTRKKQDQQQQLIQVDQSLI